MTTQIKSKGIRTIHIVKESESLTTIAREFYGNPSLWKHIYEANIDKIKGPNNIKTGQKLIIPNLPK
ncbi:LysM peptidoglycan-binding domain-containing protein [Fulvivirga sp. 29W222]|uniref:LysM peptidoglycan-binding domain-containing protein n=1 Tax=Fulvivirga marina TaxID=2494733 RepID=A0A937KBK3_9BACT|nr:LysM peptidoglycan-binding domain-containing protein [Fulvivirga marina]MBL6447031.1 LysM peptidoglycan-binding domain-containing protein [Fulvivirga marina]